jgi:tetratricopeptide (TPR) repeat protein
VAGYDWTGAFDRLAKGDWQGAADEAETVLADPARSGDHAAAWGMLGDALIKGGMPYAGLVASIEGVRIAAGPNSPFYRDVLPTVDQLDEAAWAGGPLGADFGVPLDDTTRSHLAYIAARHHFAQGSWGAVLGLLPLITPDSPYALDGRLLQGVTLAQQERFEDALVPLLDVRERAAGRDPHFQELVDLDLARTFYATGNFGRALEFYNRVSRADSAWPEALFERAWAHYRVDDMAGALGLLMTHTSPFFEDYYLPEAELLKAQSLYLMCKFPDTKETIGEFEQHYKPTLQQIRAGLGKLDAKGAWDDANNMLAGRATTLPTPLLRRFATDARFNGAVAAVAVADQDLVSLDRLKGHAFTARVKPLLSARREARIAEQGGRVLEYARASEDDLNDMLTGIELTLIDLLSHEARLYEQAAVTNELPQSPKDLGKIRKDAKKKGKRIWPFQGEYWADELGWYRVESRPDCPTDMRRGE